MRRSTVVVHGRFPVLLALVVIAAAVTGCGTLSRAVKAAPADGPRVVLPALDAPAPVRPAAPVDPVLAFDASRAEGAPGAVETPADAQLDTAFEVPAPETEATVETTDAGEAPVDLAQARQAPPAPRPRTGQKDEYDVEEYDPWEPFNETMFAFNRNLDRYILKPVAKGYDKVVPDDVQRMIANAFDNIQSIKRMVNSLLQGKWDGATRELSRFLLNSTVGMGGLFDMAKAAEIAKSREDFGQTLGFYGVGPGPYLILPFMEPLTVRDGIGKAVDGFLDPLSYVLSFVWEGLALKAEETVNDRSLNLELFQGFEETVVDMYSAVRHAYLERRRTLIKE